MIEKIEALKKENITADESLHDAGWNAAINEVLKILKAGQIDLLVMAWVDVADDLPEKGDICWVLKKNGYVEADIYDGDWWVNQTYNDIVYWQHQIKPKKP